MKNLEDIEKLKRNNKELQEIINNSWDGIGIIDYKTSLIYINNAFVPMLGYTKEELKNINFTNFMEEEFKKPFLKLLKTNFKEKKYKAEITITCIRKDNQKIFLKVTISSMLNKNLFVINARDVTALISDKEILDDYVISMHTDLHGHITSVSKAFVELFGFEKSLILGKHYSMIIHEDIDLIVLKNISKSLEILQEFSGKIKAKDINKSAIWLDIKAKAVFNKYGDVTAYTYLLFDISNDLTTKEEHSILSNQVESSKKDIDIKNRLLQEQSKLSVMNETLQRLSHEWRQPLNFISIQAQKIELEYLMGEKPSTQKTLKVLENIKNEANKLSNTIENFSDFLKPSKDKKIIHLEDFFSTLVNKIKPNLSNKNINLILNLKNSLKIKSYEEDLEKLFTHIINNSIEHFEKNDIEKKYIKIEQYLENERLYFLISDNAGGINSTIINKIFEPYFSTKEEKNGVGLGLYMCKMIVNLRLDGIITAISENSNTTIKISIPIKEENI